MATHARSLARDPSLNEPHTRAAGCAPTCEFCDCETGTPFPVIIIVDVVARDRAQPLLSFPWRVCMHCRVFFVQARPDRDSRAHAQLFACL